MNSPASPDDKPKFSYENKYYYYTSLNDEIERLIKEGQEYLAKRGNGFINSSDQTLKPTKSVSPSAAGAPVVNRIAYCPFCKNNKEENLVYNSHSLKDKNGIIVCPVLRQQVCALCGATGDNAHTPKYCPKFLKK